MVKILIAGMGRSGTSLLSKMFADLGVNIAETDRIDPRNDAGVEVGLGPLLAFLNSDASGVAKSPFLYELAHAAEINPANVSLVIMPIRDPYLATLSRLVQEMRARYFEAEAHLPGQSFSPIDAGLHYFVDGRQALLQLSQGLTSLLYQCVAKGVRYSLVPFPELGEASVQQAWAASIEDVTSQLNISATAITTWLTQNFRADLASKSYSIDQQDLAAFWRDYARDDQQGLINSEAFILAHRHCLNSWKQAIASHQRSERRAHAQLEQVAAELHQARQAAQQAEDEASAQRLAVAGMHQEILMAQQAAVQDRQAVAQAQQTAAALQAELDRITRSRSWRLTAPLRRWQRVLRRRTGG